MNNIDPKKWRNIRGWLSAASVAVGNPKDANEYLANNEFALAWDALYELGVASEPRDEILFWRNMACAAREMVV